VPEKYYEYLFSRSSKKDEVNTEIKLSKRQVRKTKTSSHRPRQRHEKNCLTTVYRQDTISRASLLIPLSIAINAYGVGCKFLHPTMVKVTLKIPGSVLPSGSSTKSNRLLLLVHPIPSKISSTFVDNFLSYPANMQADTG